MAVNEPLSELIDIAVRGSTIAVDAFVIWSFLRTGRSLLLRETGDFSSQEILSLPERKRQRAATFDQSRELGGTILRQTYKVTVISFVVVAIVECVRAFA